MQVFVGGCVWDYLYCPTSFRHLSRFSMCVSVGGKVCRKESHLAAVQWGWDGENHVNSSIDLYAKQPITPDVHTEI